MLATILLSSTIILDQLTKVWARESLPTYVQSYLFDTFRLVHSENTGAFLSLGASLSETARFWIFTVAVGIFLLAALWMLYFGKGQDKWGTLALALVVGGGISNLIDRATRGSVTDFLNVGIGWLRTGIFNIADMAIMAGIGVLFYQSLFPKKSAENQ